MREASIKSLLKMDIFWSTGWDCELEKQVAEELWRMPHNFQGRESHERFRKQSKPVWVTIDKYNWDNFNTTGLSANLLKILDNIKQCLQQDSVNKNAKNGNHTLIYACVH